MTDDEQYELRLAHERLILEATEMIVGLMDTHHLTRSQLADKLGCTRSNITAMLDGRNLTLGTLAWVVHTIDPNLRVTLGTRRPLGTHRPLEPILGTDDLNEETN